jgi:antitoxin ParD1/3/4
MATMNISLPDQMRDWVDRQIATGRFANASDYVRDVIRRDQERAAGTAKLQALIDEARASGSREITDLDVYFEEIRRRTQARLKANDAA